MKVRARLKAVEDLAPGVVCCDWLIQRVQKVGPLIFEVDPTDVVIRDTFCASCGAVHKDVPSLRIIGLVEDCGRIAADFVDLDEGAEP